MKKLLLIAIAVTGIVMSIQAQEPQKPKKTPEEKARKKADKAKTMLGLSNEQTAKVKEISLKSIQALKDLKQKYEADKKAIEAEADASLKKIFSDEQYKKYIMSKEEKEKNKDKEKGSDD